VIEDVGKRVLGEFSRRLEQQIAREAGSAGGSELAFAPQTMGETPAADALDLGSFVPARVKVVAGVAVVLALLLAVLRVRRR
jgi:hypothetical protein